MEVINIDLKNARSFQELRPPNDAIEIYQERVGNNTYHYYQDADGNLYYETDKGYAIKHEMAETQMIQKIRKRMSS